MHPNGLRSNTEVRCAPLHLRSLHLVLDPPRASPARSDRTIYEWEQSLEEVNIYIVPPAGVTGKMLDIKFSVKHLIVGIKGNPPFLDVRSCIFCMISLDMYDSICMGNR